jgi:hypothetical protein
MKWGTVREMGVFPSKQARSVIEARAQLLNDYSKPDVDPYFGEQEGPKGCSRSLIPAAQNLKAQNSVGKIVHGYAGEDGVFGVCDPQSKSQKVQVLILQCSGSEMVYEARIYYPLKENWVSEPMAYCKF